MPRLRKHIVALSGGKDSTAMALALKEIEPDHDYEYICTPTGDELPDVVLHWDNLGRLLGKPLIPVTTGLSLGGLIVKQRCLPNHRMRWCTRMLKIEPFEEYVLANTPCTVYVGIRADETDREGVAWEDTGEGVRRRYPFVEWNWGLGDVKRYLERRGVTIPQRTDCGMCFFQTLYEWYLLWQNHPNLYARAEVLETYTGHTFRNDQRDNWPASLTSLRGCFEKGRIPRERKKMSDRPAMCSVCTR